MLLKSKFAVLCGLSLIYLTYASDRQMQLYLQEVQDLSELPMQKLIQIRTHLGYGSAVDSSDLEENIEERMGVASPMALPLRKFSRESILRRGDHWDEKGKETKISKIFQLAITTLSFLAFGGYLLALVVSAIRRNSPAPNGGNVIVFSNIESLTKYKRPKRRVILMDPVENEFNTDRLYQGMIMMSEGYASYSQ